MTDTRKKITENSNLLNCPNADGTLHGVLLHSRTGTPVVLDQCDGCGGVWFDKFELFQVDEAEAGKIDPVDRRALRFPRGASGSPRCPRCGAPLAVFNDPNIPANIQMLICHSCEGFWLNHGALAGYARFREEGHKRPDPKLAEEYEKMLQTQSDSQYWQGMENFAKELGGRRDLITGLPLDGNPSQLERIDAAHDIAFSLIGTAFRLLFGGF